MRESRSLPTLWALKGKPLGALFRWKMASRHRGIRGSWLLNAPVRPRGRSAARLTTELPGRRPATFNFDSWPNHHSGRATCYVPRGIALRATR